MLVQATADLNEVGKWLGAPLIERFDLNPGSRKRKIIAMATECATQLRAGDWDVVSWDPDKITMDIFEILASSKECCTQCGALPVAWEPSGADSHGNLARKFVVKRLGQRLAMNNFLDIPSSTANSFDVRVKAKDSLHCIVKGHSPATIFSGLRFHGSTRLWAPSFPKTMRSRLKHAVCKDGNCMYALLSLGFLPTTQPVLF